MNFLEGRESVSLDARGITYFVRHIQDSGWVGLGKYCVSAVKKYF